MENKQIMNQQQVEQEIRQMYADLYDKSARNNAILKFWNYFLLILSVIFATLLILKDKHMILNTILLSVTSFLLIGIGIWALSAAKRLKRIEDELEKTIKSK